MTTIIYDKYNKAVASDTRWSCEAEFSDGRKYFFYVDDSDFEKIADRDTAVLILAGQGDLIAKWKDWWHNSLDENNLPPIENANGMTAVSLMIINKTTNEVIFDAGQKKLLYCMQTNNLMSVFAGSGDLWAAHCWNTNRDYVSAVITASNNDLYTSPIVKFVDFGNGTKNVAKCCFQYNEISNAMLRRGYFMDISNGQPAANDVGTPLTSEQLRTELSSKLANGSIVASAPVPGLSNFKWTDEHKARFQRAIQQVKQQENR
ncbi:hypothetical protein [Shewanella algae]|uniref:hypothetical protein n=1 Tax=Shewanella algae TaxID=38313 RepID=UPI003AACF1EA